MTEINIKIATESSTSTTEKFGVLHIQKGMGGTVHWKETNDMTDCLLHQISEIQNFYEGTKGTPFELEEGVPENPRIIHSITENSFICDWHELQFERIVKYTHTFVSNFPKSEAEKLLSWKFENKSALVFWDLAGFTTDTLLRMSMMLQTEFNLN